MVLEFLLSAALTTPLIPQNGAGDHYTFCILGPSTDPICMDVESTQLTMADLLGGHIDAVICIDGSNSSQALAETRFQLHDTGFTMRVNGWGDAVPQDDLAAFSRHDTTAWMDVELTYDARIAVNWFIQCIGLAWVELKLQRIGDIDGPDQPDAPIISRSLSSYIDPITQEGIDVLFMQAGRWRLRTASTHQALHTKPGFMHGFARSTHTAEFVPLGDANGDGSVNVEDILVVLAQFGPCESCHGDLDGDGNVNVVDLLQVLADWSG